MKIFAPFACCFLFFTCSFGQHVYTVRDGAWEDSSTWYHQIRPQTSGDSIFIYNRVSFHSDLTLSNCHVYIDTMGSLCGNYVLTILDSSGLYNWGFLGFYGFICLASNSGNDYPGYIDCGDSGMYYSAEGEGGYGGFSYDSFGCEVVHYGPERCLCDSPTNNLNNYLNSTISYFTNLNEVFLEMDSDVPAGYYFNFGDGTSAGADGYYETHEYADTGYYPIQVIISGCCFNDTLNTYVHIDSLPPAPPPPCRDTFTFRHGHSPADNSFQLNWQFCEDEQVTVKLYTLNGQMVLMRNFNTVEHILNQSINTNSLPSGCYVLSVEAGNKTVRKMVAVIQDY